MKTVMTGCITFIAVLVALAVIFFLLGAVCGRLPEGYEKDYKEDGD